GLGVHAGIQPAAQRLLPGGVDARQAAEGQVPVLQRVVGALEVLDHGAGAPVFPDAVYPRGALQVGRGHAGQAVGEVLDETVVADPADIGARLPVAVDVVVAAVLEAAAVAVAQVVVGHVAALED